MATGKTGFEDVTFDLVSVQYHALKAGHDYGQCPLTDRQVGQGVGLCGRLDPGPRTRAASIGPRVFSPSSGPLLSRLSGYAVRVRLSAGTTLHPCCAVAVPEPSGCSGAV